MKRIHIVEDDRLMSELLSTLLTLEGFQVTVDTNYENLESTLRESKPDVLLMDINLRHFNGLELIQRFRQNVPDQKITIIAQSGLEQRDLALISGANSFILKPYECENLIALINSVDQK